MGPLNRLAPAGPVSAYKTYQIASPLATHTRPASCEEVDCQAWAKGWITRVPITDTALIQFIESKQHGRHYQETTGVDQAEREFMFAPGQMCFRAAEHRVSLERPAFYRVRGGDWRQNTGLIREHTGAADWVDDFSEHQDKIAAVINRG